MNSGIIIVNKEAGFTSFDVVAKLRGMLHIKKIGHTGTLDPSATGVLPILIGKGTKALYFLENHDKTYVTEFVLGKTTDTYDGDGKVLSVSDLIVSDKEIEEAIFSFLGKQEQIPPMYSAKKVNGKRLYELAREGIEIERKPASIEVYSIKVEDISFPKVRMEVSCSGGTYIRSLISDIGKKLGCGAYMESLCRTKCCGYTLKESKSLNELQRLNDEGRIEDEILPLWDAFSYPRYRCKEQADRVIINGGNIEVSEVLPFDAAKEGICEGRLCLFLSDGRFAGIYHALDGRILLEKMFLEV